MAVVAAVVVVDAALVPLPVPLGLVPPVFPPIFPFFTFKEAAVSDEDACALILDSARSTTPSKPLKKPSWPPCIPVLVDNTDTH